MDAYIYIYKYINSCSVWLNAIVAGPILQQYHKWKRKGAEIVARLGNLMSVSTCHKTFLADCIIPLSSDETVRDTTTYEYIYIYYDYISINTMKMFVVCRYWNMDSISIYIYLLSCTCIYAYDCVYICIMCVCGHALHSGILERRYFVCTLQRHWVFSV